MTTPGDTLLALDFDGTLSPIVDDPAAAVIHPGSLEALQRLGGVLGRIAIVTGRPVAQVLDLSGFEGAPGLERLVVCGQYGAERWDAQTGRLSAPTPPAAVTELSRRLPDWLAERSASGVRIEEKGLAVALHTRGVASGALDLIAEPLGRLAHELGLHVEPGRQVIEVRAPGTDKGATLLSLVDEFAPRRVVFVGDDLGDLPAFRAVERLRAEGIDGYLVCSASAEQDALVPLSDLVLDGPDAVAAWLAGWADDVETE